MARPSPMAVARLREKIDTWVMLAMTRKAKKLPMMASTPRLSGSDAATALPNTRINSTRVSGRAIISAVRRSCSIWVPTCLNTSAKPPTLTAATGPSCSRRGDSSLMRSRTWSSVPAMRANTSAWRASFERRGGGAPSDQYDTAWLMFGVVRRRWVRAAPSPAAAGLTATALALIVLAGCGTVERPSLADTPAPTTTTTAVPFRLVAQVRPDVHSIGVYDAVDAAAPKLQLSNPTDYNIARVFLVE